MIPPVYPKRIPFFLLFLVASASAWCPLARTQIARPVTTIVSSSTSNGLDLQQNALLAEITNNSTAPVLNELVVLTTVGGASQATLASTSSTSTSPIYPLGLLEP
jgi:hypothetical protein